MDYTKSTRKFMRKNQVKPFELMRDNGSSVESPCLSASTHTPQDVDVLVDNNGCGISCCWSKSPRFKDSNYYSEMEDLPLMLQHVNETDLHGHKSMR
ncbi:DNA polymerase III subunit gamma/tau, partial [Trifolium medium]|nr:DNA polymerase III subunit gamma/tau [Trifolium medium]